MFPGTWWSVLAATQRSGTSFFLSRGGSFHIQSAALATDVQKYIQVNQALTCMKTKLLGFFPL